MMLGILAFALLFTAIMNYILITISSIVNRTKEVAVHKSYGASETNIHSMVLSETLVHMVCSIMVSIFLIFLCRDIIYDYWMFRSKRCYYPKGLWYYWGFA